MTGANGGPHQVTAVEEPELVQETEGKQGMSESLLGPQKQMLNIEVQKSCPTPPLRVPTFENIARMDILPEVQCLKLETPPSTDLPVGGRLRHCLKNWSKITKDPAILEVVKGYQIQWLDSIKGKIYLENKIKNKTTFVSHIFLREKKDGTFRPVFNLKSLNAHIPYEHFKMETLEMLKNLIQPGDWMIKIDLKDAYFSVPMAVETQRFLQFQWNGKTYQFRVLPFGLGPAPRIFTKILKAPIGLLRRLGFRIMIFLDDLILLHQNPQMLSRQKLTALWLLQALGFIINWVKSILDPCQVMDSYLGFIVDSLKMEFRLPEEKITQIISQCQVMLQKESTTVRELAKLIGKLTASVNAVFPAPLHYRNLQMQKRAGLNKARQSYEALVEIPAQCRSDLLWWIENLRNHNGRSIIS